MNVHFVIIQIARCIEHYLDDVRMGMVYGTSTYMGEIESGTRE